MRRSIAYASLGIAALAAVISGGLFLASRSSARLADKILAAYQEGTEYGGLTLNYPADGTLFPPEIVPPTFHWEDTRADSDTWLVTIKFADAQPRVNSPVRETKWTPSDEQWETIKEHSLGGRATVTVLGVNHSAPQQILSATSIAIGTSKDEVGAPLFYREVILPFIDAVKDPARIRWRFGEISSREQPPIVLEGLPVCGNCHSFSADGGVLGMDVDYANNKGSYVIDRVAEEMTFDRSKIITWDDYKKEDNEQTFGLLSQVSPDGKYVVSTVKDDSVFVPRPDLAFSQLFFPVKGILVYYRRETGTFHALPGADDGRFVHSNPSWSPDGEYVVFARSEAYRLKTARTRKTALLTAEECTEFLQEGKTFLYDLYRIPFNGGKGGKAEPLEGASRNGMSNYFPKYSPDGKWIVFCKAKTFMLLQPDSELSIIPAEGGQPRRLRCNTARMNSWHSWSPNSRWLVFSSKANSAYTQLFLTHIDQQGESSPPVLLAHLTASDRAANIPEFVYTQPGAIQRIREQFVDDYSLVRAGNEYMKQGDWEGAAAAYRKALELKPDNPDAHAAYGSALANHGATEEAKVHLLRAIELNPKHAVAHCTLGVVLKEENKTAEAIAHCREALKLDPDLAEAHFTLGSILLGTGSLAEAAHHLSEAARLGAMPQQAHHLLGLALLRQEKLSEAIAEFRLALAEKPDYAAAHFRLGQALLRQNDLQQAEKHLRTAIQLEPKAPDAYYDLGRLLLLRGQASEGIPYFRRAVELDPNFVTALNALARIYATHPDDRIRNGPQAVLLAERACRLAGRRSPLLLDTLAAAYAEAGNYDQAIRTATGAKTLAEQVGDAPLGDQISQRLRLYEAGRPFHASSP
jgi:tetratricopeptide (TPR) repeat protein